MWGAIRIGQLAAKAARKNPICLWGSPVSPAFALAMTTPFTQSGWGSILVVMRGVLHCSTLPLVLQKRSDEVLYRSAVFGGNTIFTFTLGPGAGRSDLAFKP